MHRGGRGLIAILVICAAYMAINVGALLASEPREFGDTYRYFGSTLWDIQNPGITPVLLYTTVVDPARVAAVQVLLATAAWIVLAFVTWLRLTGSWVRWVASVGVLALSLTAPLWSWHLLLGSESLAISAAVLWLASLVWLAGHLDRPAWPLGWLVLASTVLLFTRPPLVPVVASVGVVCAAWAWRSSRRWPAPVLALAAIAASSAYAGVRLLLLSGEPKFRYRYAINSYVDKTDSFRAYVDQVGPPCEPLVAAVNGPRPWDDVWVLKDELMSRCPELFVWLGGPRSSLSSWALAVPGDAAANFVAVMPTFILLPYTEARALPSALDGLLMPAWPVWLLSLVALVAGIVLAAAAGARPRVSWAWATGAGAIAVALAVTVFAIWGADGIEHDRHLMPLTALGVVAAFLLPMTQPRRGPAPSR